MFTATIIYASVFIYEPNKVTFEFQSPPVVFQGENSSTITINLGANKTSAQVSIALNKALHIYDYNTSAGEVARRSINYDLKNNRSFNVSWIAYITNFSDPQNIGVVLQEVEFKDIKDNVTRWASVYYYGGNRVVFYDGYGNSYTFTLNMNVSHLYNITLYTYFGNKYVDISFYVDGQLIKTFTNKINNKISIDCVEAGRFDTSNTYDLYIDNTWLRYEKTLIFDDFEDGADDFFVDSYSNPPSSGLVGKEVLYYTFPIKILSLSNVDLSTSYDARVYFIQNVGSSISSIPISFQLWLENSTYIVSPSISVLAGNVMSNSTGVYSLQPNSSCDVFINFTAPLTFSSSLPAIYNFSTAFSIASSDAVTVYYPFSVRFS